MLEDHIYPTDYFPFTTTIEHDPVTGASGSVLDKARQLGTRNEAAGFPWATARWDGSFVPFPRTEAERQALGDPRPSLAARYSNRADYVAKLRVAAERVASAGFLRAEEIEIFVSEGGAFYDRIMAHDPADRSCEYLFGN